MTVTTTALFLLQATAEAPAGAAPAAGPNRMYVTLAMYAVIFAIFYFILIRPQQRQRKAHEDTIQNLKKGDEIVTAGGLVGRVVHIKETLKDGQLVRSQEDQVTIESGTSRVVVERGRIVRIKGAPNVPGSSPAANP
jgi:preprotein translocase subunit YajC